MQGADLDFNDRVLKSIGFSKHGACSERNYIQGVCGLEGAKPPDRLNRYPSSHKHSSGNGMDSSSAVRAEVKSSRSQVRFLPILAGDGHNKQRDKP